MKNADAVFELVDRFQTLLDLGFKSCIYVDENGEQHEVVSIGSPEQGYEPKEILKMTKPQFDFLVMSYTN